MIMHQGGMGWMPSNWDLHNQLRSVVLRDTQLGQPKRRKGTESDARWNAMAIRSYKTRRLCTDLAKSFGLWVEVHHPEITLARNIRGEVFREWLSEAAARGVAESTLAAYLRRWKKIVRRMEARGWCHACDLLAPLEGLSWPGATALDRRRRGGGYDESEARRLVRWVLVRDAHAGRALEVMVRCGLRSEETFTINAGQVRQALATGGFELLPSQAKGGRVRHVGVDARAQAALRAAQAVAPDAARPLALRRTPAASRRYAWRLVTAGVRALGVRSRGLHGLRATAIRRWVRGGRLQGLPLREARRRAAERAGHSREAVIDAYTTAGPGEPREPVELPAAWVGRAAELRQVLGTGVAVSGRLGRPAAWALDLPRWEVEAAVRSGALAGASVGIELGRALAGVLAAVPRRRYPLRAGLSRAAAVRLQVAHAAGRL